MASSDSAFRRAIAQDAPAFASCIDAAYATYVGRIAGLPSVSEGCADDIASNQVWVAEEGDAVIAGIVLVAASDYLKIANLAFHPARGGKGLGRALVALAEREASRQGFRQIRLNTHVEMPDNIRFYGRLGWVETGREGVTVSMRKDVPAD